MSTRQDWAAALLARVDLPVPPYGSPAWETAPEAEKVAACVLAAESWHHDRVHLEENVRVEVEALQRAYKAAEDAEYVARRDAHRAEWERKDWRPHPVNRRREAAA